MDSAAIAKRFAQARAGMELVTYRDVAIPVYVIQVRVLVMESQEIPATQEFVLRAVEKGVRTPDDVAALLGLDAEVAKRSIVHLLQSDDLFVGPAWEGDRIQALSLSSKGRQTLADAKRNVTKEVVLPVVYDAMTGTVSVERRIPLIRPRDLKDSDYLELRPAVKRRPELSDMTLDNVAAALQKSRAADAVRYNLLGVLGLDRRDRMFRTDGVALVFRARNGEEVQVAFHVDHDLSPQHEAAYRKAESGRGGTPFTDLVAGVAASPIDLKGLQDPAAVVAERDAAAAELEYLRSVTPPESTLAPDTRARLKAAEERVAELETKLGEIEVRPVPVYEHPALLEEAMATAQHRLMIISPWIRGKVVTDQFLRRLEDALKRGVTVHIGWGLDAEPKQEWPDDQRAMARLRELDGKYENFAFARLGDTHAKVLICDDRFVVTTSFNWLSFRGDPRRPFRDERGKYDSIASNIQAEFEHQVGRFPGRTAAEA